MDLEKEISQIGKGEDLKSSFHRELEEIERIDDILSLNEGEHPAFALAKNRSRFSRILGIYKTQQSWLKVAPLSGVNKLFKKQSRELESIRASKLEYEMALETETLTPSQRSYKIDELKMCKAQEKMAVQLISKIQHIKVRAEKR